MIKLAYGVLAHHLAKHDASLDLYLRLTKILWRTSLVYEKSQFLDFASSTGTTAKICKVFCDQMV